MAQWAFVSGKIQLYLVRNSGGSGLGARPHLPALDISFVSILINQIYLKSNTYNGLFKTV